MAYCRLMLWFWICVTASVIKYVQLPAVQPLVYSVVSISRHSLGHKALNLVERLVMWSWKKGSHTATTPELPFNQILLTVVKVEPQTLFKLSPLLRYSGELRVQVHTLVLREHRENRFFHQRKWEDDGLSVWGHYIWGCCYLMESYCSRLGMSGKKQRLMNFLYYDQIAASHPVKCHMSKCTSVLRILCTTVQS